MTAQLPQPEPSARFANSATGFRINAREGEVYYTLALEPVQPLREALFLEVFFENPADPAEPHVKRAVVPPGAEIIRLESPPLSGLRTGEIYKIEVLLFDGAEAAEPVDRHLEYIHSPVETERHEPVK